MPWPWLLLFRCFLHSLSCWCCCQRTLCHSLKDFSDLLHLHCALMSFWLQSVAYNNSSPVQLFGFHRHQIYGSKSHPASQWPRGFSSGAQTGLPLSLLRYHANFFWVKRGLRARHNDTCDTAHADYDSQGKCYVKLKITLQFKCASNAQPFFARPLMFGELRAVCRSNVRAIGFPSKFLCRKPKPNHAATIYLANWCVNQVQNQWTKIWLLIYRN